MRTDVPNGRPAPGATHPRRRLVNAGALLFVAAGAAVAAALLLTRYMDARAAAARDPTVRVVAAKVDIPVAAAVRGDWLTIVDWPAASRPDGAEGDPARLVDRVALVPIARGEPVLAAKLAEPGARGGLASLVPGGMRAVAVRVDDLVGVAGFIHPGDRVDVIVTMAPGNQEPPTSKVILQNVQVLAVGKDVQHRGREVERPAAAPVATLATLVVAPDASERLALAASRGRLLLTLRGIGDDAVAETPGARPAGLLAHADAEKGAPARPEKDPAPPVRKARPTPRPPPAAETAAHAPAKETVEIIRGDLFERRDFARAGGQ